MATNKGAGPEAGRLIRVQRVVWMPGDDRSIIHGAVIIGRAIVSWPTWPDVYAPLPSLVVASQQERTLGDRHAVWIDPCSGRLNATVISREES